MQKTRRIAAITLVPAVLLALTACGPDHGVVHDKRFSPATVMTTCIAQPKGGCIPSTQYIPESWAIDLYNDDEHGWRDVDHETFDHLKIGDYVDFRNDQ